MMMMMNNEDEYEDEDEYTQTLSKKRKSNKNKRRFSDDQIKSLETIFESESKLEPRKKLQLARELGLQPRQVAIWFQNKRARYKSKQLEQDYGALRADYNNLASQFETLEKEKQALQAQLQKLNDQLNKSREVNQECGDEAKSKVEPKPTISDDNSSIKAKSFGINKELKLSFSLEKSEHNISVLSDEDSSIKNEYFGFDDEPELLNMLDPADSTLTSPEHWGSLEREGLLDQSGSSYQWWDVWN